MADSVTIGDALGAVAARRAQDPDLRAEAEFVEATVAAARSGDIPPGALIALIDGPVFASALATWGPGDDRARATADALAVALGDLGYDLTGDGWVPRAEIDPARGVVRAGTGEAARVLHLVEDIPTGPRWQRRLLVLPPPRGSVAGDER